MFFLTFLTNESNLSTRTLSTKCASTRHGDDAVSSSLRRYNSDDLLFLLFVVMFLFVPSVVLHVVRLVSLVFMFVSVRVSFFFFAQTLDVAGSQAAILPGRHRRHWETKGNNYNQI